MRTVALAAAVVGSLLCVSLNARAGTCEELASLALPYTTIMQATSVAAGTFTPPTGPAMAGLPAFCRVVGTIRPTGDSNIGFEVWLPTANWNGKFEQVGNGGFAGSIPYVGIGGFGGLSDAIVRGYATAATDDGHQSNSMFDASWAVGHPEKVVDFGYRAVHETAVTAKAVIAAFYGADPVHSYFYGCSSGGREAMMAAQRFPADYDGIVAGAPAIGMTHLMAAFASNQKAMLFNPASYVATAKLPAIQNAALDACDAADGIADGIINDPQQCRFDPSILLCSGTETNNCLTAPQLIALQQVYAGPRSDGMAVFPGLTMGNEAFNLGVGSWSAWVTGSAPGKSREAVMANQFFGNMVIDNPAWTFLSFDVDNDVAIADARLASTLNATDPDLSRFIARGGKLIMHHGWGDPAISSYNSVDYYRSVTAMLRPGEGVGIGEDRVALRRTQAFFRLFMEPGVNHCGGGPGPNNYDMLDPLARWVENGVAPDRIIASHLTNGIVDRTRPLCPYPAVATYIGSGSTDDAANFACVAPDGIDDVGSDRR